MVAAVHVSAQFSQIPCNTILNCVVSFHMQSRLLFFQFLCCTPTASIITSPAVELSCRFCEEWGNGREYKVEEKGGAPKRPNPLWGGRTLPDSDGSLQSGRALTTSAANYLRCLLFDKVQVQTWCSMARRRSAMVLQTWRGAIKKYILLIFFKSTVLNIFAVRKIITDHSWSLNA